MSPLLHVAQVFTLCEHFLIPTSQNALLSLHVTWIFSIKDGHSFFLKTLLPRLGLSSAHLAFLFLHCYSLPSIYHSIDNAPQGCPQPPSPFTCPQWTISISLNPATPTKSQKLPKHSFSFPPSPPLSSLLLPFWFQTHMCLLTG